MNPVLLLVIIQQSSLEIAPQPPNLKHPTAELAFNPLSNPGKHTSAVAHSNKYADLRLIASPIKLYVEGVLGVLIILKKREKTGSK